MWLKSLLYWLSESHILYEPQIFYILSPSPSGMQFLSVFFQGRYSISSIQAYDVFDFIKEIILQKCLTERFNLKISENVDQDCTMWGLFLQDCLSV